MIRKLLLSQCVVLLTTMMVACNTPSEPGEKNQSQPSEEQTKDVRSWISTADNTMHFDKVGRDFNTAVNTNIDKTLYIKPNTTYQQIDGFGIALNGSACYNLMLMSQEERTKILKETFSVSDGMGYSYTRISIGCSDFSLSEYTCCDVKGIENFSLTNEEIAYVIPVLKEVIAINPNIKIMGSPWTCPRWMKVADLENKTPYNDWVGGFLNPDYYQDYAEYFVKWIKAFEERGIKIESVTVENEPLNWGNSASLYMGWEQQRDFIKTALGPKFEANNIKTKIICFDHNYNYDNKSDQASYPAKIYADAEASKYVDGAAYHNYGGAPSEMSNIHNNFAEKNLYFTEASIGTWNYYSYDQSFMDIADNVCMQTILNWARCAIMWNYMLDNGSIEGPYRPKGCTTCYGALQLDANSHFIRLKRAPYYALGQMSRVLLTGSTRIGVSGYTPTNTVIVASSNPDGTYGLVILNKNDQSIKLTVDDGTHTFDLTLPAKSMTSCLW